MIPFLFLTMLLAQDEFQQHPDLIKVEEVHGYLEYVRCNTVQCSIQRAASTYNVPLNRLTCLARRESTFNPNAVSPDGRYHGLMQFDYQTWQLTPYRTSSIYNGEASAMAAAYLISRGESRRWPVYSQC